MQVIKSTRQKSLLNTRLEKALTKKGWNLKTLSELSGVSLGSVHKMATDPDSNPTMTSLESVARALSVSIAYLIGENVDPFQICNVPLLNWQDITLDFCDFSEMNKNQEISHIAVTGEKSENLFALKVEDRSMEPVFPEKSVLVFNPEKEPYDGSYVLLWLESLKKSMFKELLIDEPDYFVRSINPNFSENLKKLDKKDKIIATLVQTQLKY